MKIGRYKFALAITLAITISVVQVWSMFFGLSLNLEDRTVDGEDLSKPWSSSGYNQADIDDLLDGRLSDFDISGNFEQFYEPSIRDTYYALYIANALGKVSQLNGTEITNYIMSRYSLITNKFQDDYSLRFYDLGDSEASYQSSPLLAYCYAVLALDILGQMGQIQQTDILSYIWSCFDYSTGGFWGYPNPTGSPQDISTAENTYYAVKVLNHLGIDWMYYSTEKTLIVNYLNLLQDQNDLFPMYYGSFKNDQNDLVETVAGWDPNLRSCFYAIKTLNSLDMQSTINDIGFRQYLGEVYNDVEDFFCYNYFEVSSREYNVPSTAYGIDLAGLVGFSFDSSSCIDFLLNNRNQDGGWGNSDNSQNYELVDTFEVIKYFYESSSMDLIGAFDKSEIFDFLLKFQQEKGFSTLSRRHTSIKTISSTVSAFKLNSRESDLDIQQIYDYISDAHIYYDFAGPLGEGSWYGLSNTDYSRVNYRTAPLEYKSTTRYDYSSNIAHFDSNEYVYYALDALEKIYKLDDFSSGVNLTEFIENLAGCQFLEPAESRYGGFLPSYRYILYDSSLQNKYVSMRYTYFTLKVIQILDAFLTSVDIGDLGIDTTALGVFINKGLKTTSQYQYYQPYHSTDASEILENTYFMVYAMLALDMYNLDSQKIINYASSNMDYTNLKDTYNLWRLSQLLNYSYNFDIETTRNLIDALYDSDKKEYFPFVDALIQDTDALYWICDIAANDETRMSYEVADSINLGFYLDVSATLCNLVMREFNPSVSVKFESEQLGDTTLARVDSLYYASIFMPLNPGYLGGINASLRAYESLELVVDEPIFVNTNINISASYNYFNASESVLGVEFVYSVVVSTGHQYLADSSMYADIYFNGFYMGQNSSTVDSDDDCTYHAFEFEFIDIGLYHFDFYVSHPYLNPLSDPSKELTLWINYTGSISVSDGGFNDTTDDTTGNSTEDNDEDDSDDTPESFDFDAVANSIPTISVIAIGSAVCLVGSTVIKKKKNLFDSSGKRGFGVRGKSKRTKSDQIDA